jgi:hypothetical protein
MPRHTLADLADFVMERRYTQLRKDNGFGPPWSAWPAMQTARINNVYREHDRFSLWEAQNLNERNIVVGRFFMSIPATKYARDRASCQFLYDEGLLFNPCVEMKPQAGYSHVNAATAFLANVEHVAELLKYPQTVEEVQRILRALVDLNDVTPLIEFRRYEMLTSLSYLHTTSFHEDSFFHVGPGAAAMCEEIFGSLPAHIGEFEEMKNQLKALLIERDFRFVSWPNGVKWSKRNPKKFTVRQLEDCLCEFRKYQRALDHWQRGVALPEKYRYVPASRPHTN